MDEGYTGQRLQDKLAENGLHTSDTIEETISVLSIYLSAREIEGIKIVAPEIYEKLCNR